MRCTASKPIHSHSGLLLREKEQTALEGRSAASALHLSRLPIGECTAGCDGASHWRWFEFKRCSRSLAAPPSARRREQLQQPGRSKVCGRERRRALCARCTRLVSQASPRAARHARTHEYLMHHTAWKACSPHVLTGCMKAVELTDN